jgi:pseudaminic acid cytidylyltransferase
MNIAVIPARGGSKRIPRKNIRHFRGKPMIAWSIEAAQQSGLFDHILVSTDDPEVSAIARATGAETPFVRPVELSGDHTPTAPVIAHATRWALNQGWPVQAACCIYATAPFVRPDDLKAASARLESGPWAYVFTATDFAAPIFRSFQLRPDGGAEMFFPEHFSKRSQDLPRALHDAGQFYWGRTDAWLAEKRFFEPHSSPLIIPRWRVQDIDTEDDWTRAEQLAHLLA